MYVHMMYDFLMKRDRSDMAKAKLKQVVVPQFSSEAQEAAWWDSHRSEVEAEIRRRMKEKKPLTLGTLAQRACHLENSQGRPGNGAPLGVT